MAGSPPLTDLQRAAGGKLSPDSKGCTLFKKLLRIYLGKKELGANKELRFTQNDLAKIQDKTIALGEVGNPLQQINKMKEKQIKFMESNFGLTEFAYIQRNTEVLFKDGRNCRKIKEIARFERSCRKSCCTKALPDAFRPFKPFEKVLTQNHLRKSGKAKESLGKNKLFEKLTKETDDLVNN